jgi:hypothetical protein
VWFVNLLAGSACSWDNSGCAFAGRPELWRGRAFTADGRPADHAVVDYVFGSEQTDPGAERATSVPTDEQGRYCLRWPQERLTPFISAQRVRSSAAPDPRLLTSVSRAAGPIIFTSRFDGVSQDPGWEGTVMTEPWDPRLDGTTHCTTKKPPWYRIDDLGSNWRYRLPICASLVVILLDFCALFATAPYQRRLCTAAALVALNQLALFALIWVTHTI